MLFAVNLTERAGWVVLSVVGDVDLASVPVVRQRLAAVTGDAGVKLVLDLGGVDHVDSVGLGVVVGALKRVRRAGGELRVVAGDRVRQLFELTSLDRVLELSSSVDEAVGVGLDEGRRA